MQVLLILAWIIQVKAWTLPRLKCMSFYGLETERMGLVCDWAHHFTWYLDGLVLNIGIDTLRIPFSYELVKYHDLAYLDQLVSECNIRQIRIILDWHRTWSSHQGPYPEENITRSEFIDTWIWMLERYPTTFGVGIFNEIQGVNSSYANDLHREVITRIEERFPDKFYYFAGCVRWGGDCSEINLSDMPTWDRTYVEVHKYIFSGDSDVPDWDHSIPTSISSDHWFIGETGWKHDVIEERMWAEGFLNYLVYRNISSVCAWTIAHSGDTEGWWKDDCNSFNWEKAGLLRSFWNRGLKRLREFIDDGRPKRHPLLRLP